MTLRFGQTKWNCALAGAGFARVRELGQDVLAGRLEPVLVGVDVVGGAEALVRDGAVVALEVVLAADLPVRGELVFVAGVEDQVVNGDEAGHGAEGLGERRRVRVGVDEQNGPHVSRRSGTSESPSVSKPSSRSERGAARSDPSSAYVHAW